MDLEDLCTRSGSSLETIRALHQTIVALRTALEESKTEISGLKQKSWPIESVQNTLTALSIENHVLKQQILENNLVEGSQENLVDLQNKEEVLENVEQKASLKEDFLDKVEVTEHRSTLAKPSDTNYNLFQEEPQCTTEKYLETKHFDTQNIGKSSEILKSNDANEVYDLLVSQKQNHYNLSKEHIGTHYSPNKIQTQPSKIDAQKDIPFCNVSTQNIPCKKVRIISPKLSPKQPSSPRQIFAKIQVTAEKRNKNKSKSLESLTILKSPANKKFSFTKTISFSNLSVHREFTNQTSGLKKVQMVDKRDTSNNTQVLQDLTSQSDLDQEVDDIELIFTTDDTDGKDFKEELVPIDERESNSNLLQMPLSDYDQISDRELDDDVFNDNENQLFDVRRDNSILNSKSDNSINHEEKSLKSYYSYQDSSFEKSFENKSLEKDESFDRFEERVRIVETDISKIGIQELEYVGMRRNTCPNPIQYRPFSHRDAMTKGTKKTRPILTHSSAMRRESEAQTDISAIPGTSWRSESSLAHKVKGKLGEHFTTLPSKIPLPGSRLRLSEKTVEARRVLLSDIGFTSMVPELSRSADHLCPGNAKPTPVTSYGQFLRATDLYSPNCASQKFTWTATTTTPSDVSQSQSRYGSVFPLYSPPAPSRRCSAPVSPSRRTLLKSTLSKVRFANGSLPELRSDWSTVDSGDSTDSLVDEAENYLRRSIDCIVTGRETVRGYGESKRAVPRRASAPEPCRDNVPPMGWQPFLPRLPRDLKLDHWVKVITPEGKVRGGRIRYVGLISSQGSEHFIGVQLACPEGVNDGTWGNRRYFQCEPYHGIFVPFKKVIMGWRP